MELSLWQLHCFSKGRKILALRKAMEDRKRDREAMRNAN